MSSKEGKAAIWWQGLNDSIDRAVADNHVKHNGDGATYGQAMLSIALMQTVDNSAQRVGTQAAACLTG